MLEVQRFVHLSHAARAQHLRHLDVDAQLLAAEELCEEDGRLLRQALWSLNQLQGERERDYLRYAYFVMAPFGAVANPAEVVWAPLHFG